MGLFDNFFKGIDIQKAEQGTERGVYRGKINGERSSSSMGRVSSSSQGSSNFLVFCPNNFDDVQTIIDHLKRSETVILNLKDIKPSIGQRIIDFLSGAVYALDGSISPLETGFYLLTPDGVNIVTK